MVQSEDDIFELLRIYLHWCNIPYISNLTPKTTLEHRSQ